MKEQTDFHTCFHKTSTSFTYIQYSSFVNVHMLVLCTLMFNLVFNFIDEITYMFIMISFMLLCCCYCCCCCFVKFCDCSFFMKHILHGSNYFSCVHDNVCLLQLM